MSSVPGPEYDTGRRGVEGERLGAFRVEGRRETAVGAGTLSDVPRTVPS
jgi:hypothetical protein